MREILFRGKRCDNGEWVYGDLCHYSHGLGCFIQPPIELSTLGIEVKTETVGQYTGLTDKNGKKVFEGDIVKANVASIFTRKSETVIGSIVFLGENFYQFKIKDKDGYCREITFQFDSIEVIGNIHDNPEMLRR